ncbi:MAG: hypothetical protein JO249_19660, partial [Acidobacteria bacterium]|nr:hypothetical protein [Acidobacteriota bacterium]
MKLQWLVLLGLLCISAARADSLFVVNFGSATVGEYTTSGATVNAALISDSTLGIDAIAVSESNLFTVQAGPCSIGEYTTLGALVNSSLISGLNSPVAIAI